MNARQRWGLSQAGLGALALAAPGPLAIACAGTDTPVPRWLIRLFGARLVGQGCLLLLRPTDEVIGLGSAVDALHGTSMLVAAIVKPEYRRSALIAGALAAGSFAIDMSVKA